MNSTNNTRLRSRVYFDGLASALIGLLFGAWFIGPANVLPWSLDWLNNKGDGSYDQLAFEFFRSTPVLQWPITAMPNYVTGSNQVLGSGNGLFAIPAKIIGKLIPGEFQYLGVWIVFCFVLQGYFAEKIISRITKQKSLQIIAASNFIIAPILVYRIGEMKHFQLGAHWLILAAIYLSLLSDLSRSKWMYLLMVSVFINIYISAMVVSIFVFDIFGRSIRGKCIKIKKLAANLAIPLLAAVISFLVMGYASYGENAKGSNFFRLSPISFVNTGDISGNNFSYAMSNFGSDSVVKFFTEEPEGFQYLGLGVLIFLSMTVLFSRLIIRRGALVAILPMLLVAFAMFLYAMSNRISIFGSDFVYWWPTLLHDLREVFRASSRFGWPLYYLVTVAAFLWFSLSVSKRSKIVLSSLVLTVSLLDGASGMNQIHREISRTERYVSTIQNDTWFDLANNRDKLYIYPNFDLDSGLGTEDPFPWRERWFDLAKFAVSHDMEANFGGTPRPIRNFVLKENQRIANQFSKGMMEAKSIYIIGTSPIWEALKSRLGAVSDFYYIDGLYVVASKD
jgi:hypothetical protein